MSDNGRHNRLLQKRQLPQHLKRVCIGSSLAMSIVGYCTVGGILAASNSAARTLSHTCRYPQ
eukprot:12546104-Alexandrium_andersonii.AAC.1